MVEQGEIVTDDRPAKDHKKEKKHKSHKEHKSSKDHKSSKEKHKDKDKDRSKRSTEVPVTQSGVAGTDGPVLEKAPSNKESARDDGHLNETEELRREGEGRERGDKEEPKEKRRSTHSEHKDSRAHRSRDEKERYRDSEKDKTGERHSEREKRASGGERPQDTEAPAKRGTEDGRDAQPIVQDSGGEISMSIEETNKLRISLGLKPLKTEAKADEGTLAHAAHARKVAEAEKKAKADELAERIKSQREKREMEKKLKSTKALGAAGDDVDDLAAWVEKSRAAEAAQKAAERAKAEKLARQFAEEDEDMEGSDSEEDEGQQLTAAEMAGLKVRHKADELEQGETVVLTLADRGILDEKGELVDDVDELEEVARAEQKKRAKAIKAATKINKPLFGEDGKTRAMLEKYDEEQEDEGMVLDEEGGAREERRKEEIRAKLAQAQSAAVPLTDPSFASRSEYYTQEEMAQLFKPKKKKKKKVLRKKGGDDDDLAELAKTTAELEAAAELAGTGKSDRGSRALRESLAAKEATSIAEKLAERNARYERALEKANYRSLALKNNAAAAATEEGEDEEAELQEVLARARRAAQAKAKAEASEGLSDVAVLAARRRQEQEAQEREGALAFTEAAEFARTIQLRAPEADAGDGATHAEPTAKPSVMKKEEGFAPDSLWGDWVTPEQDAEQKDEEAAEGRAKRAAAKALKDEPEDEIVGIIHEKSVGRGLAGALALLNDRKELAQPVQWAGRTNDMRPEKLMGLADVYTGGRQERPMDARVEAALTRRDEFGRVLTPKESFRQLCYKFHGKEPSKNKQEKRLRKIHEDMEQKRLASSEQPEHSSLKRLHAIQEVTATPYLVLSGKIKPGQISDPASGYATEERGKRSSLLAGGDTPLIGKRKVEVMLGLNGEATPVGALSMPPPPPRRTKTEPV